MNKLLGHLTSYRWWVGSLVVLALLFLSRFINLLEIPIFTDEAIYLRWAQIGLRDANFRFLSLIDGKPPLFVWLAIVTEKFISDPLLAGRLISALSGVLGALGVGLVSWLLFKNRLSCLLAVLFYIVGPFFVLYDRLAIMDSLLNTLGIYTFVFAFLTTYHLRLDTALILGHFLGASLLTKASGAFFLYLLPVHLLVFKWKVKNLVKKVGLLLGLMLLALILSQALFNILRLSPLMHMIGRKNTEFILSFPQFFAHPFALFPGNLVGLTNWLVGYLTWPFFLFSIAALFFGLVKKRLETLLLFAYFLFPFLTEVFFNKVLYPRFLLFASWPFLVLSAYFASYLWERWGTKLALGVLVSILIYPSWVTFKIIFDPVNAPLVRTDREQYFDSWPSGYGILEIVSFLKKEGEGKKITVGTEGTFGLLPYALQLYLSTNSNITIWDFWPVDKVPEKITKQAKEEPTYFIYYQRQKIPEGQPIKLIAQYRQGKGDSFMRLYQVLPQE